MSLNINKKTYQKMIEDDLQMINKYIPDGLEKEHIKIVLKSSINVYYKNEIQKKDICNHNWESCSGEPGSYCTKCYIHQL